MEFEKILPDLKALVDDILKDEKRESLLNPGFLLGFAKDICLIFPMTYKDEGEKAKYLEQVVVSLACYEAEAYGGAFTSWVVAEQPNKDLGCQPRHHPDRKDAIVLIAASQDKREGITYLDEGDRLGKSLMREGAEFSGRFFELLRPPEMRIPPAMAAKIIAMGKKLGFIQEFTREDLWKNPTLKKS
jgi:hypothetical protein